MSDVEKQGLTACTEGFWCKGEARGNTGEERREEGSHGNRAGPAASDVEAFSTAARALDVGVVKDELAGQLALHVVHLRSQQGQLGLLLYEHGHTC